MIHLTDHQNQKLDEFILLVNKGEKKILVKGSAGTGKTTLVNFIVSNLPIRGKYVTAPTHKALSILEGKVEGEVIFKTIHALLQYRMIINPETGERDFIPNPKMKGNPLAYVRILVIDEASMIGKDMLEYLEEFSKESKTLIIFLGDEKQINPVGEDDSPVFHQGYPEVELTEIIRQAGDNPIIQLSQQVRELPRIFGQNNLVSEEKGYLFSKNEAKVVEELAKVNGTDEFKYLAWTNNEVDRMNTMVRRRIYGDNPAQLEIGETIIINSPHEGNIFKYNTNDEVRIHSLEKVSTPFMVTLEDMGKDFVKEKKFLDAWHINNDFYVLAEESRSEYRKIMAIINNKCKQNLLSFNSKYAFMENFATFKYNHALSIHKSQGSTYKNVVLNLGGVYRNPNIKERERLLYTGITRASDLLILLN